MLKIGHIYQYFIIILISLLGITGITQDARREIHSLPHLMLNRIIQVSDNIMVSLKLIFVFNNVFCFVIITIYLKMWLSTVLLIFRCANTINCSFRFVMKEFSAREFETDQIVDFEFMVQRLNHKTWDKEATKSVAKRRVFMFHEVYYFIHKAMHYFNIITHTFLYSVFLYNFFHRDAT